MNHPFTKLKTPWLFYLYRILLGLLLPFIMTVTLCNAWRRKGGWRFILERFGLHATTGIPANPIWIHAASVGEIQAILPLLKLLEKFAPKHSLLVTTATPTGAHALKKALPDIAHAYLPIDYAYAIKRFLKKYHPAISLIVETELWPVLFSKTRQQHIPILIVNGRLSSKTLNSPDWLKPLYRFCLQHIDQLLARSETDRQGFIQLGAASNITRVIGNIKFSAAAAIQTASLPQLIDRPYVVAASTHHDEELTLAGAWHSIETDNHLLIIVPRHPERRHAIIKQLTKAGFKIAVRSHGEQPSATTRVYLADTMGELTSFIAHAEWVIMGGSLIPHGGQNLLEPAALGKAIVTGPYMHNFSHEREILQQAQALIQTENNPAALLQTFNTMLHDKNRCRTMGTNAAAVISQQRPVATHYLEAIESFLRRQTP